MSDPITHCLASDSIGRRFTSPIIMTRPVGWRWAGLHRISRRRKKWLRSVSPVLRLVRWPKSMWVDEWATTQREAAGEVES